MEEVEEVKEEKKTFKKMLIGYRDYDLKIKHYKWLIAYEEQKDYTIRRRFGRWTT